ncbi:MAG: hypothetical protein Q7T34_02450, partial [Candidatus Parcubacteria bacterium]|nr:hypothetical protein [Candidatus Parcubacteria bacterium]
NMPLKISPKLVSLSFGVLVLTFALGFYIFAWTEPGQAPPGGNILAPLNIGPAGQSKEGGLILNTGGASSGLIVDKGDVGIGITTPGYKLDVVGSVNATELCISGDCKSSWPSGGSCLVWKDCDGDTFTGGYKDCDEGCSTCYVGSASYTASPDGKDQNCDGTVDNLDYFSYQVVDNEANLGASGVSCNQVCSDAGGKTCVSTGLDTSGTNNQYLGTIGGYCYNDWSNCSTVMASDNSGHLCYNYPTNRFGMFTYCRCAIKAYR